MCSNCSPNWEPPAPGDGETFDPIADAMDARRHARERAERAAAGIPEPTIAELAKGFRISNWHCVNGCDEPAVEGGCCVSCASWRFGEVS